MVLGADEHIYEVLKIWRGPPSCRDPRNPQVNLIHPLQPKAIAVFGIQLIAICYISLFSGR